MFIIYLLVSYLFIDCLLSAFYLGIGNRGEPAWMRSRKRINKRSEVAVCGRRTHTARGHGASLRSSGGRAPSRDVEHVSHRGHTTT